MNTTDISEKEFIVLLGETGTGKTTFVNRATNTDAFIVGNGLHSCTSETQVSPPFLVDGHPVILIDTPGFNDSVLEDTDVLEDISAFLATVYENKVQLAGVVYLHRISDERWRRSDTRSFGWLKRICGETTLRNVVLATTMWDNINPNIGAMREAQLAAEFLKPALDKGAQLLRHHDTTESALDIIRAILRNRRAVLQVQQELVDEKREFDRTTVGEGISEEVEECTRKLEREVARLQSELENAENRVEQTRLEQKAKILELQGKIKKHSRRSENMNEDYNSKKQKSDESWTSFSLLAGFSLSSIILGTIYICSRLWI